MSILLAIFTISMILFFASLVYSDQQLQVSFNMDWTQFGLRSVFNFI